MASSFKGVVEKFKVTLVNDETGSTERVTIQLSLDGLKLLNQDASRTLRSYNLRNVARWDLMDTSTVIWTKTDVDLEERPLTLSSDPTTIRNVVDTLATCCLQLAEIIQDKESDNQTANNLQELAAGGGKTRKAAKLPSVDSVEYWRHPDKSGWLQSQSEVMKMWRKRWFVLKQGYLFRFLSPDVSESVKPRGVVDLSKVQDVRDGRAVTSKANTIQLKTAAGPSVCYICESETEMVEWISAIEGSIAKIVKLLAGVEDAPRESSKDRHAHRSSSSSREKSSSSSNTASEWAKQMERSTSQTARRPGGSSSSNINGSALVSVVDYSGGRGSSSSSARGGSSSSEAYGGSSGVYGSGGYPGGRASAPSYADYGGISNYNQISGVAGISSAMDDLTLNYGGYQTPAGGQPPPAAAAAGAGSSSHSGYGPPAGAGYASSGSSSSAPAVYAGSGNAYGGSSSSNAYGSSGNAYGSGGYGSSGYQQDPAGSNAYGYAGGGSSSYQDPAAAAPAGAGYGYQQQQQQQPAAYTPAAGGAYGSPAVDGGYYQPPQQQQQQQPPAVSLIDQVPSQQPGYPYYQQMTQAPAAAAAAAVPAAAAGGGVGGVWQVHHTTEGRPYYFNSSTCTTQWEEPPGMNI